MKETLEIKCECGHWNHVPMHKFFLKQRVPKISVFIPVYKVTELVRCEKCGRVIARAGELLRSRTPDLTKPRGITYSISKFAPANKYA